MIWEYVNWKFSTRDGNKTCSIPRSMEGVLRPVFATLRQCVYTNRIRPALTYIIKVVQIAQGANLGVEEWASRIHSTGSCLTVHTLF